MRWVERVFGVLGGLSGPIFVAFASFQVSWTETCTNGSCTVTHTSEWQQHPVLIVSLLFLTTVSGAVLAGLIYAHSATVSRGLLITMWVLVPIFALSVIGFSFTFIGSVAFYYAVGTFFAALAGSVVQFQAGRGGVAKLELHRSDR